VTTLTTAPVAGLLDRLFADSDTTKAALLARMGRMAPEQVRAFMQNSDPRPLYAEARDAHLAISRKTGTLLYILARAVRARAIIEFGTSFGVSTLHLAAALRDNGGGRLIGSDFEPSKVAQARANLDRAGLADLVEVREGDALETFARDLPDTIDLLFLDGAKPLYPAVLSLIEPRLSPGAILVADNADDSPAYLERVRSGGGYLSVAFGEVEISIVC
jgi:predicted O-methyltransferase YrrM